ncbi:MAG: hypothetical protein AAF602_01665 [Myxococcota bacterium]
MSPHRFFVLFALCAACELVEEGEPVSPDAPSEVEPVDDTGIEVLPPEDYTLVVDEGAASTVWKYGNSISAVLCATIDDDGVERTLRIYGATVTPEYTPYCADSGAFEDTVLRFRGRYINTPGEGWVDIDASVTGTIISGSERFNDDQTAELVVEVTNPADATIAPARFALTVQTTSSELFFTFAKTP